MPVTVRQVAEAAGVSRSTANMILTGRTETYAEQTCARVLEAAQRLSYRPNLSPKSREQKRSFLVGAVLNRLNNPFLGEFVEGLQAAITERGCAPTLFVAEDARAEVQALDICIARQVDGLIVNPNPVAFDASSPTDQDPDAGVKAVRQAVASGIPAVEVFGRSFSGEVPTVIGDAYLAGRRATQNLIELGNRRILLLQSQRYHSKSTPNRLNWFELDVFRGYNDSVREAGLEPWTGAIRAQDTAEERLAFARHILSEQKPDAVFTQSRRTIDCLHHLCQTEPALVPKNFSLASFQQHFPTTTSNINRVLIELPISAAARQAVQELFNIIDGREGHDCSLSPIIDVLPAGE